MKIYTKTGDTGKTGLVDSSRVSKASSRIALLGSLDEANAYIGLCSVIVPEASPYRDLLFRSQRFLFDCGARIADPADVSRLPIRLPMREDVKAYESSIDELSAALPLLQAFILPGGIELAARLHVARSVVRRAERLAVQCCDDGMVIEPEILMFLNRLSDWLFVVARFANAEAGMSDVLWQSRKNSS